MAAAILHKLDQLDLRRAGVVPLCGQDGLFKYEIQVKTGWSRGAGECGRRTLLDICKDGNKSLQVSFNSSVGIHSTSIVLSHLHSTQN